MQNRTPMRAILAIDNDEIRSRACRVFEQAEYRVTFVESSRDLQDASFVQKLNISSDLILIETGDDVALLNQAVYSLYKHTQANYTLWIIGMLSNQAIEANLSVAFWLIDGHSALLSLLATDDPELYKWMNRIAIHLRDLPEPS